MECVQVAVFGDWHIGLVRYWRLFILYRCVIPPPWKVWRGPGDACAGGNKGWSIWIRGVEGLKWY